MKANAPEDKIYELLEEIRFKSKEVRKICIDFSINYNCFNFSSIIVSVNDWDSEIKKQIEKYKKQVGKCQKV